MDKNIDKNISGMNHVELLKRMTLLTKDTILYIHYDKVDERSKKSITMLLHNLREHGFHDIADLIEDHTLFINFSSKDYALKVHDFLNENSAAISCTLFHKGLTESKAEYCITKNICNLSD